MIFPSLSFKIAASLIEQQLADKFTNNPQTEEPADLPDVQGKGLSALRLLGKNDAATAKENSPKVLTNTAVTTSSGREANE